MHWSGVYVHCDNTDVILISSLHLFHVFPNFFCVLLINLLIKINFLCHGSLHYRYSKKYWVFSKYICQGCELTCFLQEGNIYFKIMEIKPKYKIKFYFFHVSIYSCRIICFNTDLLMYFSFIYSLVLALYWSLGTYCNPNFYILASYLQFLFCYYWVFYERIIFLYITFLN